MQTQPTSSRSLLGLFGNLASESKNLLRQEVQLAKTELSEKFSSMSRNTVSLAIGGAVAYAGVIVFLIGLGGLIAWGIAQAGLGALISSVIGVGGLGLIVTIVGVILVLGAVKKLKEEPLKPERTLQTLQDLRSTPTEGWPADRDREAAPSSAAMQAKVEATEVRLSENLTEIGDRLSPQHLNDQVRSRIQANPYRAGLIAAVLGFVGGIVLRKRFHA